ncbi:MAG TPA: glycosyltransferase family A protein, partial [Bacteroidales bacterium]|nr:glycosyltransferase family A protein [Bacteroidales bacterium]
MKKTNIPRVSIIVPVYNTEKYLEECLSSLENQTYKNIEIIIVNDGSTDRSGEIIDNFLKKNKKNTIVLKNIKPSGCGQLACNQGIKKAHGIYIAIMDSDDVSCPDRIKKEVDFLEKHKDYFLVSSSALIIDENSKIIGKINVAKNYNKILKKIFLTNSIINSSVLFRKSMVSDLYKVEYKACNDYLSWIYHLSEGKK